METEVESRYQCLRERYPLTRDDPDEIIPLSRGQVYNVLTGRERGEWWNESPSLAGLARFEIRTIEGLIKGFNLSFGDDDYYAEAIGAIIGMALAYECAPKKRLRRDILEGVNELIGLIHRDYRGLFFG